MNAFLLLVCLMTIDGIFGCPFTDEHNYDIYQKVFEQYLGCPKAICKCSDGSCNDKTMASVCGGSTYSPFMDLLERYLKAECDLVDPTGCMIDTPDDEFDFIVVGSGAGGSVVTSRLSENPNDTVLLLEAGGPMPTGSSVPAMYFPYVGKPEIDWNFVLESQNFSCRSKNGSCRWPRGKVMGGTTVLNGMMYIRGHHQDWDSFQVDNWTFADVAPYFLKSEDNKNIGTFAEEEFHVKGGYMPIQRFNDIPPLANDILAAVAEFGLPSGIDLNGKSQIGFTAAQALNDNGARVSTARAFLYKPEVLSRKNLQIRTNAHVTRVLINETTKVAYGVEFSKNGALYLVKARKGVVLSAGAVQSPQILMLSGVGPKEHLEKFGIKVVQNLPGVGRNLKNHASFSVAFDVLNDNGYATINYETIKEFFDERKGPMTSTGLSQLTGFIHTRFVNPEIDPPDVQIFFEGFTANCSKTGSPYELANPGFGSRLMTITPTVLRPKSVGYLELRDNSSFSPPKIYANLLEDPQDVQVLIEGIRFIESLVANTSLKNLIRLNTSPVRQCPFDFNSDTYWECAIRWFTNPENHQVGTCKIGPKDDPMAVTEANLQVRGVENLWVIDASIFPDVPTGNLFAPVVMVGERGADFIKAHYKQ